MSTLTKVFVVLLVLFSIAFTSMTVSIVAQTTNWKDTALKYQEHARIADTNLRHEIAAGAALLATARDDVRAHLSKIGQLETDRQAARTEAGRLRSELAKADSEKSSSEAMNRGLLSQLDVAEAARSEYRSQRDTLETRSIDIERRNVDLNDRVNELTARVDVLFEQRRHFEQQINILRSENDALARQTRGFTTGEFEHPAGMGMVGVRAETPVAARKIRGRIREVADDLVTISVGSADGVKKGMIFVMHRKDQYVGDLRIDAVNPNESAGRITVLSPSRRPALGDTVTDAATMQSRG